MSDKGVNLKSSLVQEHEWGVCLWEVNGLYLSDDDGFLSMEGRIGDPVVERKMRDAAKYWMADQFVGRPAWIPGARMISDDEYDDQQARLIGGLIPDEVDAVRQSMGITR